MLEIIVVLGVFGVLGMALLGGSAWAINEIFGKDETEVIRIK